MAFLEWYQLSSVLYVVGYTGPEIVSVKEDNVELTARASVAAMVAGSFFHDITNERLYVSPTDGTNPNTSGYTYIAFVWIGFCNVKSYDYLCNFYTQGQATIYDYMPFISSGNMPAIRQSISTLYNQVVVSSAGGISFINADWWYENRENYIFHNAEIVLKKGAKGDAYGDFDVIFTGIIRNPTYTDSGCSWLIEDKLSRELKQVPQGRFNLTDYPDLNSGYENTIIPVLLGEKTNITPILIDTTSFTYKITETVFAETFAMEAITAVYADGVALATPADYSEDLANGEFTLTADPGDAAITCDAKGLKINRDFSTSTWVASYDSNIARVTFFILNQLAEIPEADIDETALSSIRVSYEGVGTGVYFTDAVELQSVFRQLQSTGNFHIIVGVDGIITFTPYRRSTAPTTTFKTEDLIDFEIREDTENIHARAVVYYDQDPTSGGWLYDTGTRNNVAARYQSNLDISFETYLITAEDARDNAEDLVDFFDEPTIYVKGTVVTGAGFNLKPLDKIYISRSVTKWNNSTVTLYDAVSFVIVSIDKDITRNMITFTAQKDLATLAGLYVQDHNFETVQDHNLDGIQT